MLQVFRRAHPIWSNHPTTIIQSHLAIGNFSFTTIFSIAIRRSIYSLPLGRITSKPCCFLPARNTLLVRYERKTGFDNPTKYLKKIQSVWSPEDNFETSPSFYVLQINHVICHMLRIETVTNDVYNYSWIEHQKPSVIFDNQDLWQVLQIMVRYRREGGS